MSNPKYNLLAENLEKQGIQIEAVKSHLKTQQVETPSWGYGNSGTRFGVFAQPGAATKCCANASKMQPLSTGSQVSRRQSLYIFLGIKQMTG